MASPTFIASSHAGNNSTGSASITCNYPAGSSAGDLLVMMVGFGYASTTASYTLGVPAGWTQLDDENRSNASPPRMFSKTYYRFRGAETNVTVSASGSSSSMRGTAQILAFNGSSVDPTSPVSVSGIVYSSTTGSSVARTAPTLVTPTAENTICWFGYYETTASRTTTWSSPASKQLDIFTGATAASGYTCAIAAAFTAGSYSVTAKPNLSTNEWMLSGIAVQPPQFVPKSGDDVGGVSSESAQVGVAASDLASGADPAPTVTARVLPSETATSTDQAGLAIRPVEPATVVDTAQVIVRPSEGIAADDTAGIRYTATVSDTGAAEDTASASSRVDAADAGAIVESAVVIVRPTDTAAAADSPTPVDVDHAPQDLAAALDATTVRVPLADQMSAVDSRALRLRLSDTGAWLESSILAVRQFGADVGTLTDSASVVVSATDESEPTFDDAYIFIEGVGVIARRIVRIPKEARQLRLWRDPFVYRIKPEGRLRIFGLDDRTKRIGYSHRDPERVFIVTKETDQ